MKVRVFTANANGKVEFTKEELEKLLNEVYQDAKNGCIVINTPSNPWWDSPTITLNGEANTTTRTTSDKTLEIKY